MKFGGADTTLILTVVVELPRGYLHASRDCIEYV